MYTDYVCKHNEIMRAVVALYLSHETEEVAYLHDKRIIF